MNKEKIINWLKSPKPITLDWKWIIIIILLFYVGADYLFLFGLLLIGCASYPHEIDVTPIFEKVGNAIGNMYTMLMSAMYEVGFTIGEITYPYNTWIVNALLWSLRLILIFLILWLIVKLINGIMFNINKKEKVVKRINEKQ